MVLRLGIAPRYLGLQANALTIELPQRGRPARNRTELMVSEFYRPAPEPLGHQTDLVDVVGVEPTYGSLPTWGIELFAPLPQIPITPPFPPITPRGRYVIK